MSDGNTLTCPNCGEWVVTPSLFMLVTGIQTFDREAGMMEQDFDTGVPATYPFAWICTDCGFVLPPEMHRTLDHELRQHEPGFHRYTITIEPLEGEGNGGGRFQYNDHYTPPDGQDT